MALLRQNPFPVYDTANRLLGWRWYDETGCMQNRTYPTQMDALRDLMRYVRYLERGPTLWQRVWWPVRYTLWPKVLELLRS
jgi:hypothetical protein